MSEKNTSFENRGKGQEKSGKRKGAGAESRSGVSPARTGTEDQISTPPHFHPSWCSSEHGDYECTVCIRHNQSFV